VLTNLTGTESAQTAAFRHQRIHAMQPESGKTLLATCPIKRFHNNVCDGKYNPPPFTNSSPTTMASRTPGPVDSAAATPFYDADNYQPELGLLYMLRQAQLAIAQRVSDETELGGSTIPQWLPLYKVHSGHANTVAELARKCTVDAGAMTRLLDRLESKGLCRRVRSETDRRVVQIELTPEGEEVAQRVPLALSRVYNAALADFSHEEWQQLRGFLLRLRANAERGAAQASQDQA
jgi:DNA-binding MarR family transcriptional regulator